MHYIKKVIVSLFLLLPIYAGALTLDEAVQLALQSEDSIQENEFLTESQMYISRASFAAFLPVLDVEYLYTDSDLKDKVMPKLDVKTANFTAKAGLNVFNGFQDVRNYQMAGKSYDIQTYAQKANSQNIILATKTAYMNYLKAQKYLNVSEETMKLLEIQKQIAEVSYNVGNFSKSDVLRVDVQLASTQLDLLNAQINLKIAKQHLEKMIGRQIDENEVVVDITIQDNYEIPKLEELYSLLENRSDMMNVKESYEMTVLNRDKNIGTFLPRIDVGYSYIWYGDKYDPFTGRKALDENGYDKNGTLAISATWNLFKGFYDYNTYLSSSAVADASACKVSDARKNMRLETSSTYENYFSALERLAVADVAVEQARESYRVTKSQYENSEATTTDLLDASIALNSALTSQYVANYDLVAAIAQIERIIEKELGGYKNLYNK